MNTKIIAVFAGIAVLLVAITGYAGSLNAGTVPAASGATADASSQPLSIQASGIQGEVASNVPAGQFTLGNAPGHTSSQ